MCCDRRRIQRLTEEISIKDKRRSAVFGRARHRAGVFRRGFVGRDDDLRVIQFPARADNARDCFAVCASGFEFRAIKAAADKGAVFDTAGLDIRISRVLERFFRARRVSITGEEGKGASGHDDTGAGSDKKAGEIRHNVHTPMLLQTEDFIQMINCYVNNIVL
jgi:hypothetical protein